MEVGGQQRGHDVVLEQTQQPPRIAAHTYTHLLVRDLRMTSSDRLRRLVVVLDLSLGEPLRDGVHSYGLGEQLRAPKHSSSLGRRQWLQCAQASELERRPSRTPPQGGGDALDSRCWLLPLCTVDDRAVTDINSTRSASWSNDTRVSRGIIMDGGGALDCLGGFGVAHSVKRSRCVRVWISSWAGQSARWL